MSLLRIHYILPISLLVLVKKIQRNAADQIIKGVTSKYGKNNETYVITLPKDFQITEDTQLRVDMNFTSLLTEPLKGFYRVSYNDIDDENKK